MDVPLCQPGRDPTADCDDHTAPAVTPPQPIPQKPLQIQGLFFSLITSKAPKDVILYLAPFPTSTAILEPLYHPNKPQIFRTIAKSSAVIFHLYIYTYLLNASTKHFAPYPHHGYRWLFKISQQSVASHQGFDLGENQRQRVVTAVLVILVCFPSAFLNQSLQHP
jgi:hypothetical protein